MGFFDFLKPKPVPALAPAATLEELLAQAVSNPAYQPEFYRRLLVEPLVVLTAGDPATAEEQRYVSDGSPLQIVCWEDGTIPVFTTPARIFDQDVRQKQVVYNQLKGRAMLQMLRGKVLLLNPYSDHSKELLPAEVDGILDGTVLGTLHTTILTKPTELQLAQPRVLPTEMLRALASLLDQQPRVRAAYFSLMRDPHSLESPQYLIYLDIEGNIRAIAQQVNFVAKQFVQPHEGITIMQANSDAADATSLAAYFRKITPFYQR